MIQTILITALSAQLTYLKPVNPAQPQTPQYTFTRVLPKEDNVKPVVQKPQPESVNINIPEIQKTLGYNAQLLEPMAGASASPTIINSPLTLEDIPQPTTTPTLQPTAVPTVVVTVVSQAPSPMVSSSTDSSISDAAITYLGNCEAGMNPTRNSGNGYYGAFQFSYGTWRSLNTGFDRADLAPIEVQEAAVRQLLSRSSIYNQFPACAQKMRAAGLI